MEKMRGTCKIPQDISGEFDQLTWHRGGLGTGNLAGGRGPDPGFFVAVLRLLVRRYAEPGFKSGSLFKLELRNVAAAFLSAEIR